MTQAFKKSQIRIKKVLINPHNFISKAVAYMHSLSALMVRNRLMDVMMKILLPACFIALKLTGSFIDFMLGLANSNVQQDINTVTPKVRDSQAVNDSFNRIKFVRLQIS